jgi:hypothetical protein
MVLSRKSARTFLSEREKMIQSRRMTPSAYCEKWVPVVYGVYPGETGYRNQCILELCKALDLNYLTMNKWGAELDRYPKKEKVERTLAKQDCLNEVFYRSKVFASQEDSLG